MKNYISISKPSTEGFRLAMIPALPKMPITRPAGPFVFIDPEGNESEVFAMASNYSDGFAAVVSKYEDWRYQFRDTKGILSETYAYAHPYSNGFAIVQTTTNGSYQFRDLNGSLSEEFYKALDYNDGFGLVRKTQNSPCQYRDTLGNLSEEYYSADSYSQGFARVQKHKNGSWQFRDTHGNLSEEYYHIQSYHDGFAVIQKTPDSPYQLRDLDGNLSEEFYEVDGYKGGFAMVQPACGGYYRYRDTSGRYSEEFDEAYPYSEGLAIVQKYKSREEFQLRDIRGFLSDEKFDSFQSANLARLHIHKGKFGVKFSKSPENTDILQAQISNPKKYSSVHSLTPNRLQDYYDNKITIYDLYAHDIYNHFKDILNYEISKYNQKLTLSQLELMPAKITYSDEIHTVAKYMKETASRYQQSLQNTEKGKEQQTQNFEDFDENTLI